MGSEGQLSEFIEGLGPGQLVGRQVLASPSLGDIQLSMCDKRGHLEVEVIRARGLQCKPGSKTLPGDILGGVVVLFRVLADLTVSLLLIVSLFSHQPPG